MVKEVARLDLNKAKGVDPLLLSHHTRIHLTAHGRVFTLSFNPSMCVGTGRELLPHTSDRKHPEPLQFIFICMHPLLAGVEPSRAFVGKEYLVISNI